MNAAEYELEVASVVERGIRNGDHGIDPRCARVIRKPKHYSRDRERDTEFDASVEVTRPKESDPFLYWVIECKHDNHNVPVDDAEEFFAKLQQIGGANSKGTIVSKTGFASGTIAFCRSKGIGLWRYDPEGERTMAIIFYRPTHRMHENCRWAATIHPKTSEKFAQIQKKVPANAFENR